MRNRYLLPIIFTFLIFCMISVTFVVARRAERGSVIYTKMDRLVILAEKINEKRVYYKENLSEWDLASENQLEDRIYWLGYYSYNREEVYKEGIKIDEIDYNWKQMWNDLFAMVWYESWFVNYKVQDEGLGFGWSAMRWDNLEWLAEEYQWNIKKDMKKLTENGIIKSNEEADKIQAKYMVGLLLWLYDYYDGSRELAITGYNKGTSLGEGDYKLDPYYIEVKGRISVIEERVNEEG